MEPFSLANVPSPAQIPHGGITFSTMLQWAVIVALSTLIACFLYSLGWNLWFYGNSNDGRKNIEEKHHQDATSRDKDAYQSNTLTDSHGYKKILKEIQADWNTYAMRVNTFIRMITCGRVQQALYLYPGVRGRRFFHCRCCNEEEYGGLQDVGDQPLVYGTGDSPDDV